MRPARLSKSNREAIEATLSLLGTVQRCYQRVLDEGEWTEETDGAVTDALCALRTDLQDEWGDDAPFHCRACDAHGSERCARDCDEDAARRDAEGQRAQDAWDYYGGSE